MSMLLKTVRCLTMRWLAPKRRGHYQRGDVYSRNIMLVVATSVILLTGCAILPQEQQPLAPPLVKPAPIHYITTKVTRGTIMNAMNGNADFVSTLQVALSYKLPQGRIATIDVQSGQTVRKGRILMQLDTTDLSYQLQQAELQFQKAQLQVEELRQQKADQVQIRIAEINVKSDKLKDEHVQQQIQASELVSPMDGEVTDIANLKIGDAVSPDEHLLTISDAKQLVLRYATQDAEAASNVVIGMPVDILYQGQNIAGKVVQVAQNTNNYETDIRIRPDTLPSSAKMGDSADIRIVMQKKSGVVLVPRSAIHSAFGDSYVHILVGSTVQQISVQTGIQNATDVEIVSGLRPGQTVIVQ